MFSLWALYVKKNNAHKVVEIDAQTEIAYEWHSPYFNEQPSASWDFSVPRTPYNEALLLNTTENGELYPLSEGYFDAYFRGLPWQADSEIDEGLLTVVKISTRRITLQFKQVCSLLERLTHKDERSTITISNETSVISPYNDATVDENIDIYHYFLCFAETLRATGVPIAHDKPSAIQKIIVGIRLPELLRRMLPKLTILSSAKDKLQDCFIIPSAPNFTGKITPQSQSKSHSLIRYRPNSDITNIAYNDNCGVTTETPQVKREMRLDGTLQLWGGISARELLTEILAAFSLHLRVQTFINTDNTTRHVCTIISPHKLDADRHALGHLATFKYYAFTIPHYPTETERTQSYNPNYEPYTPFPLIGVPKEESKTPHENWRYFNRHQLIQFHPPITDGAEFYTPSEGWANTKKYSRRPNPVHWTSGLLTGNYGPSDYRKSWPNEIYPTENYYDPERGHEKVITTKLQTHLALNSPTRLFNAVVNLDDDYYVLSEGRWKYVGHKPETQPRVAPHVSYRDLKLCRGRVILAQTHPQEDVILSFDVIRAKTIGVRVYSNNRFWDGVRQQDPRWYGYGLFHDQFENEGSQDNAWKWLPETYKTHSLNIDFAYHENGKNPDKPNPKKPGLQDGFLSEPATPVDVTLYDAHGEAINPDNLPSAKTAKPRVLGKGAWLEEHPTKYPELNVYSEVTVKVQKAPCVHAIDVPTPENRSSDTVFYLRTLTLHTIANHKYLYGSLRYTIGEHPILISSGQKWRCSLTGLVNRHIEHYTRAYYAILATAIEGELETWDEAIIFASLFWHPYPSNTDSRIGSQRINHLSVTLRQNECHIRKVNVIQFNLPATL